MTSQKISQRQQQYIIDNYPEKSIKELAKHLNLSEKDIQYVIDNKQTSTSLVNESKTPQTITVPRWLKYSLISIGLIALFIYGFYFRMYPAFKQDFFLLDYDYGFHLRMTEEVLRTGHIPAMDNLAWYPDGKPVVDLLPVILYYLGAGFFLIYKHFSSGSVQDAIVLFYSIMGALTMIAVYFLVKTLEKKDYIAFIGAALAAVMPAHLVRTFCTRYRYEGPGLLFLLINMTFFIKALQSKSKKQFYIYSIASALFMLLSVGTWRVSLLFPTLYCIAFILLIILKRTDWRLMGAYMIQSIAVACSALGFRFLFSQNYIFSHNALLIIGLGIVAAMTKWWKKTDQDRIQIDYSTFLIPAAMVFIIPLFHLASGYESFIKILMLKIAIMFKKFKVTGIENILFLNTAELSSTSFFKLFKWDICSWGAIFIVIYPVSLIFFRKKHEKMSKGEFIMSVFFFTIFILTLLFYRNKVLLSIFVAIAGAISVNRTITFFNRFPWRKEGIVTMLIFTTAIILGSAWKGGTYVTMVRVEMRPYLQETLLKFDEINKDRLPTLSYWSYGYAIQRYAHCPTYLDGLLESPRVHERLVEMSQLLFEEDESVFYEFCQKYGMKYFVVDADASRTQLYALYAEYPYGKYYQYDYARRQEKPTSYGDNIMRTRFCMNPQSLTKFKLLYHNPRFRVYQIL